jgi:hypothetical protein
MYGVVRCAGLVGSSPTTSTRGMVESCELDPRTGFTASEHPMIAVSSVQYRRKMLESQVRVLVRHEVRAIFSDEDPGSPRDRQSED